MLKLDLDPQKIAIQLGCFFFYLSWHFQGTFELIFTAECRFKFFWVYSWGELSRSGLLQSREGVEFGGNWGVAK